MEDEEIGTYRTYRIMRNYLQDHPCEVIAKGQTMAQARAHCRDPETSSQTCTSPEGIERTKLKGPWFDGFLEE